MCSSTITGKVWERWCEGTEDITVTDVKRESEFTVEEKKNHTVQNLP